MKEVPESRNTGLYFGTTVFLTEHLANTDVMKH